MADLIEMPFGVVGWVDPRNEVLDWGIDPLWQWTHFGEMGWHNVLHRQCGLLPNYFGISCYVHQQQNSSSDIISK